MKPPKVDLLPIMTSELCDGATPLSRDSLHKRRPVRGIRWLGCRQTGTILASVVIILSEANSAFASAHFSAVIRAIRRPNKTHPSALFGMCEATPRITTPLASQDERRASTRIFFRRTTPKTPANSHVKPPSHSTLYQSTTSPWRMSYFRTVILDIELKNSHRNLVREQNIAP